MERLIRNIETAFSGVSNRKFQSFLSALGALFGAMSFVLMVSIGLGSRWTVIEQIKTLGGNVFIILPGRTSERSSVGSKEEVFTVGDVKAIERMPGSKDASPGLLSSFPVKYNAKIINPEITGVAPSFKDIRMWKLRMGRFIGLVDIQAFRKVCVIGDRVMDDLFGGRDPLGKSLLIGNIKFTVIGALQPKGFSISGRDQDYVVYLPYTAMGEYLLSRSHINFILSTPKENENPEMVGSRIEKLLRRRHSLKKYEENAFRIMKQSEFARMGNVMSMTITVLLGAAAIMTSICGGVNIMSNMLAATKERTREIGIRMACGAKRRDVEVQFFTESLIINLSGVLSGIVIGIGISLLMSYLKNWAVILSPPFLGIAFMILILIGVGFGYWPARKAAQLNPIDALRHE